MSQTIRKIIVLAVLVAATFNAEAQKLPPFLKWATNNSADCKNVFLTKDSMVLAVKNKCTSEGVLANWRPAININEPIHFAVPVGLKIQLTITYNFQSIGGDVFAFNGSFDPVSDNSDISFSRSLQLPGSEERTLAPSKGYTSTILLINFSNETDKPVWKAPTALNGSLNLDFNVTNAGGDTHTGSVAVIKAIKAELVN